MSALHLMLGNVRHAAVRHAHVIVASSVASLTAPPSRAVLLAARKLSSTPRPNTAKSKSGSPATSNPFAWYGELLETHPLLTKAVTGGIIAASGDVICQNIPTSDEKGEKRVEKPFDFLRTLRFGFLGFALIAPAMHHWYGQLMARIPGTSMAATLKRTALDQLVFAPVIVPTFMGSLFLLQGKNMKEIRDDIGDVYADTILMNWSLWVPAMLVNFGFTPLKYQVLFSNTVGLGWNTYLSYKTA